MVTGVYRSNKSSKPAVKPTNPSKKQPVKRKLDEQSVNEELSQQTLQDKTVKKQKQNSDVMPINESEVTAEITKNTNDKNSSDITIQPMAENVPENTSEDDKSDDMPLAILKTKTSEVKLKPTDDIRRQSEDISEDDIPLATMKAKLGEKIKLVEDLSGTDKNMAITKEFTKSVEPAKQSESQSLLSLIPSKDSVKENISDSRTNNLDNPICLSNDDIPLSEALLTKPTEMVGENRTPSPQQKISITISEAAQAKEIVAEPVKAKATEAKPVPVKPALVTSSVVKPNVLIVVKSDAIKVDELLATATTELVAEKTVAAKLVATEMVAVKSMPTKPVVAKPVQPKALETEAVSAKTVPVKRVIVKTVAKKSIPTQSVTSKTVALELTVKSSTATVDSTRVENASKPSVPTPPKTSTNVSTPIESKSVELKSPEIKSTESRPVETTVVPVIDLTDSADAVKQEIDDPEFDAARVADRRKSLNELIDLCSDTSSEPPNRSPASSTSCKRYKDYDNIDEQLEADMEREQQYFDGVDEAHDRNLWNPLDEEQLPSSKFK